MELEKYAHSKYRILWATFLATKWSFLLAGIPRIFATGFTFCQPLLIHRVLSYLSQPDLTDDPSLGQRIIIGYGTHC